MSDREENMSSKEEPAPAEEQLGRDSREDRFLEEESRRTLLIAAVIVSLVALAYVAVLMVGGRALRGLPGGRAIQEAGERIGEIVAGRPPAVQVPPLEAGGPVGLKPSVTPVVPVLSPSVEPPAPGDPSTVTFTIEYENTTGVRLTGVRIKDDLPGGTSYKQGSANPPASLTSGTLTWNLGTLEVGQKGSVAFQVTTTRKGKVTNTAVLESNEAPSSSITSSATVG